MDRITIVCNRTTGHPRRHPRVVVARFERDSETWRRVALDDKIDDWTGSSQDEPQLMMSGNVRVEQDHDGSLYAYVQGRRVNVNPEDVRDLHRLTCPHCFTDAQDTYSEVKLFNALDLAAGVGASLVTMAELAAIVQATAEGRSAN